MNHSDSVNSSLVRQVAQVIRSMSLAANVGAWLGGEDELVAQIGVSRPTFRQASKLVEQERLVRVKRGVGGGFFADRPDSAVVTHMTAIYLHTRHASLQDILYANRPLFSSTVRLATENLTPTLRGKLAEFAGEERVSIDRKVSTREFVRSARQFASWMAEACGNPLIQLFQEIVLDLSALVGESIWIGHPERIAESRRLRLATIDAILAGNAELAAVAASQISDRASQWASESSVPFKMVTDQRSRPRKAKPRRTA
jgi:DNA-binding FadR family transcriptional regulator